MTHQTALLSGINENLVIMGGVVNHIFTVMVLVIVVRFIWWVFSGIFFRGA
jgi:hypothetical protein